MYTIESTFADYLPDTKERLRELRDIAGMDSPDQTPPCVFDSFVQNKVFVTGITIGKVNGASVDDVDAGLEGVVVVAALTEYHMLNYPGHPLIVVWIQDIAKAVDQVRQTLRDTPPAAGILFVCSDQEVYEAAMGGLGIDYQSAKQNAQ